MFNKCNMCVALFNLKMYLSTSSDGKYLKSERPLPEVLDPRGVTASDSLYTFR